MASARLGAPGYLTWKGHRDVVSGASLEVQEAILTVIRQECPGDAVLAEEGPEDEPLPVAADRLWIVDPVCGSLNFVQGVPLFAVSVALRVGRQVRVGVVHDPARDETFAARVGGGATLNGRTINVLTVTEGSEAWKHSWIGTDLPPSGPRREEALRVFDALASEVISQTIMGSPSLGFCYVACGRLHVYWDLDAKPWDVAAGALIVEEAGGLVTDPDGGPWTLSDGGYVAGVPAVLRWVQRGVQRVREHGTAAGRPPSLNSPEGV